MSDRRIEAGFGMTRVSARPYVTEDPSTVGQAWLSGDIAKGFALTGLAAFDDDAAAGGVAARFTPLRTSRLAFGFEQELGVGWFAASLPLALRLFDETWIYTAPRLSTWGIDLAFTTGAGASVRLYDGLMLRAEWQRSWQDFMYYNVRDHHGLAIAHQFP